MIVVHGEGERPMFLNADLIATLEEFADDATILTMVDGHEIQVSDPAADIIDRIRTFRASVLATVEEIRDRRGAEIVVLHADSKEASGG